MKDLKDFKVNKLGNFIFNNLKINVLEVTDENVDLFNDILNKLRNNKDYTEVERNEKCRLTFYDICFKLPCYCYFYANSFAELFIADIDGIYRIQLKHVPYDDKGKPVWGRKAFSKFEKMLEEDGINLKDYAIENGKEVKEEIEMPLIKLGDFALPTNIFHIPLRCAIDHQVQIVSTIFVAPCIFSYFRLASRLLRKPFGMEATRLPCYAGKDFGKMKSWKDPKPSVLKLTKRYLTNI